MAGKDNLSPRIRGAIATFLPIWEAAWACHLLDVVGIRTVLDLPSASHNTRAEFQSYLKLAVETAKLQTPIGPNINRAMSNAFAILFRIKFKTDVHSEPPVARGFTPLLFGLAGIYAPRFCVPGL